MSKLQGNNLDIGVVVRYLKKVVAEIEV